MKLIKMGENNWVTPAQMKDGQIGIIRKWDGSYVGKIIQKYGNNLVCLGLPSGKSFSDIGNLTNPDCLIYILPPGTTLEI